MTEIASMPEQESMAEASEPQTEAQEIYGGIAGENEKAPPLQPQ